MINYKHIPKPVSLSLFFFFDVLVVVAVVFAYEGSLTVNCWFCTAHLPLGITRRPP